MRRLAGEQERKTIREGGKRLRLVVAGDSTNAEKVVFSFEHFGGKSHGFDSESSEFKALVQHLKILSSMTWQEIQNSSRHKLGSETIPRGQIREPIPPCLPEKNAVLSFRYSGMKPFIGIRNGRVLDVLYIDPSMDIYDHS